MQLDEIINYFKQTYPDKKIVLLPEKEPKEIICEVDPSFLHPEYNHAIAAIKSSEPHYHKHTVETYKVLRGKLKLNVDGGQVELREGEEYTTTPEQIHFAEGDFTLVAVDSKPGWTPEDHFLVES
ncbi:MAG TPA: cupin domain-containing protein [Candidatus Limnocylindrales bacterium]|nr:cupin domain-containing protein [Candidatus Limnocylindrales bacterium]